MAEYIIYRFYVIDPKTQKELSYVGYKRFPQTWSGNPDSISGSGGKYFLNPGSSIKKPTARSKMAQAINTYGWNNFRFQELDRSTNKEDAGDLKWAFIQQFNSMAEGLNIQRKGTSFFSDPKPIEQYTKDGKLVAEYESVKAAARALYPTLQGARKQVSVLNNINTALKMPNRTAFGYVWKYKKT